MCMHNSRGGLGGNEVAVKMRVKGDRGFQNGYLDISLGEWDKGIDTAGCKTTMSYKLLLSSRI